MTSARALRFSVGAKIGEDLTVLGALDEGGTDAVYIVWHHRAWCPMACKVFATAERAKREADVLAALAHPNIVRPLGLGQPPHLLMEYLEGPTLSRLLKTSPRRRLRISDALRVAIHLGGALAHMHGRGFLHLDVKPRNAIVTRGRPVLFDFGTVRPRRDWGKAFLEGTDPYMAPEQCRRQPVSPATDVYGLGVILYEMIAGGRPFPDGSRRRSFPQLTKDPTPLRRHRPSAARMLEAIVHRCINPDPALRPTLVELLPELHRHIRGGAPMWPAGFRPTAIGQAEAPKRPHAALPRGACRDAGLRPVAS
jgi:serine/threonine protein kinase